jgi:hypothetical protein
MPCIEAYDPSLLNATTPPLVHQGNPHKHICIHDWHNQHIVLCLPDNVIFIYPISLVVLSLLFTGL